MPKKTAAEKKAAREARKRARQERELKKKMKKGELTEEEVAAMKEKMESESKSGKGKARKTTMKDVLEHVAVTGKLSSLEHARDIHIDAFSITLFGRNLIEDTKLELNFGRRYGLVAQNGAGKSTLLQVLASRSVPIPDHINIWFLNEEAKPSDRTAMEVVMHVTLEEKKRLDKLENQIMEEEGPESKKLQGIYELIDGLEIDTLEARAGELLYGLGFSVEMMHKATKDMSGGWRMRVSLAQALLVQPHLLLLDEPTNHLDLGACIWLEDYLSRYPNILFVTSHSQDFLNTVCTNTYHLNMDGKLVHYTGNYDSFVKTRKEKRTNQLKQYKKEQEQIAHIKKFIASCGTYSNLVKQAQSKQKIIDKMVERGLTKAPKPDPSYSFRFPNTGRLAPPIVSFKDVSFSYSGKKEDYLYTDLEFGIDQDSRIALVGPNGVGKSTLLKLLIGSIQPVEGSVSRHSHLRFSYYNQHSEDQLDLSMNPIEFMMKTFPKGIVVAGVKDRVQLDPKGWRPVLGKFGITGARQKAPMYTMSDGLRTRVVFALLSLSNPHILLLDEPTNHLDMECIDSLADAINHFEGGLVLVSHDFRLIKQVAKEIWVCDNKTITPWKTGIKSYKDELRKQGEEDMKRARERMARMRK
jgi:ATP-binding cassette, subfamily F, member 2